MPPVYDITNVLATGAIAAGCWQLWGAPVAAIAAGALALVLNLITALLLRREP